jgi:hypothetical protein
MVVPSLLDVCTPPAMWKSSTSCPKSTLTDSEILTVFHLTLNQWQKSYKSPNRVWFDSS